MTEEVEMACFLFMTTVLLTYTPLQVYHMSVCICVNNQPELYSFCF